MPPHEAAFFQGPPNRSGEGGALCTVLTLISKEPINNVSEHLLRLSITRPWEIWPCPVRDPAAELELAPGVSWLASGQKRSLGDGRCGAGVVEDIVYHRKLSRMLPPFTPRPNYEVRIALTPEGLSSVAGCDAVAKAQRGPPRKRRERG